MTDTSPASQAGPTKGEWEISLGSRGYTIFVGTKPIAITYIADGISLAEALANAELFVRAREMQAEIDRLREGIEQMGVRAALGSYANGVPGERFILAMHARELKELLTHPAALANEQPTEEQG